MQEQAIKEKVTAGFNSVQVLQETQYLEDKTDGRMITSLVVKPIK